MGLVPGGTSPCTAPAPPSHRLRFALHAAALHRFGRPARELAPVLHTARPVALGTALRALTLALFGLAGCAGNIGVGEGEGEEGEGEEGEGEEGEGEEGEGEGEEGEGEAGEGEGEPPLPAPEGAVVLSPRFAVPADGISAIRVDLQLTPGALAAPIAGRTVVVRTREAGPTELPASVSAADGTVSVDLVSTVSGQFTIEVEVDGAVIDVGAPVIEFDTCRTLEETFVQETYPVALGRCVGCHNEFGYAPAIGARFILPFPGDDDFAERGIAAVRDMLAKSNDITERNGSLDAWPHTGVLSVPSFLNRYPTTASNRERTRARTVMESFLAVPVMKLAAFATPEIPEGTSLENLTWAEQPCVVCHTVIDPPAGAFNMFTGASGALTARRNCRFEGMRSPGLGFIELPGFDGPQTPAAPRPALDLDDCSAGADGTGAGAFDTKGPQRLRWLAEEVAAHPRFAYAVVVPLYEGILGTKVLSPPDSLDDPDFTAKARAFATQQKEIAEIVAVFRAEGGRFRPVVKAILLSRSFRADTVNESTAADDARMRVLELLEIGTGSKLATPENLDRRLTVLTGLPWANLRVPNRASNLSADGSYSIFFGGIDSEFVTERSRDPVAIKAAVARRLGNEVSCIVVPQEFSIVDKTQRKLFRDADLADLPLTADGAIDPAVDVTVRAQVRRLHAALWNEPVVDDAEVEASVALFYAAMREMRAPAAGGTTPNAIGNTCAATAEFTSGDRIAYPATGTVVIGTGDNAVEHRRVSTDPNFTVRAWMAVLSSILADTRVLME